MNNFEKIKAGDLIVDCWGQYGIVMDVRMRAFFRTVEVKIYLETGYIGFYEADRLRWVA